MVRRLATASFVALLALLTISVVWTGLNWPPPLWIAEYGLPGSQGPTGRVARIGGVHFVESRPPDMRELNRGMFVALRSQDQAQV